MSNILNIRYQYFICYNKLSDKQNSRLFFFLNFGNIKSFFFHVSLSLNIHSIQFDFHCNSIEWLSINTCNVFKLSDNFIQTFVEFISHNWFMRRNADDRIMSQNFSFCFINTVENNDFKHISIIYSVSKRIGDTSL